MKKDNKFNMKGREYMKKTKNNYFSFGMEIDCGYNILRKTVAIKRKY